MYMGSGTFLQTVAGKHTHSILMFLELGFVSEQEFILFEHNLYLKAFT